MSEFTRKPVVDESLCALDNPDLPTDFIKTVLDSKETDRDLAEPFSFDEPDDLEKQIEMLTAENKILRLFYDYIICRQDARCRLLELTRKHEGRR